MQKHDNERIIHLIGIFDSGLGGLTAVKEIRRLFPSEQLIYFGDTGRVPYGTRSKENIVKYAMQDMRFLLSQPESISAILVACGTVSSVALDVLSESFNVPIIGVVNPAAEKAVKETKNGIIGVIGTGATIKSGSYEKKISELSPGAKTVCVPCPLLVSLVENGFIEPDNMVTKLVVKQYLAPIKSAGADTLILGCTHYPIIADIISAELPGVRLINSGSEAASKLAPYAKKSPSGGGIKYFVSDNPDNFGHIASIFLEEKFDITAEKIDIEKY